MYTSQQLEHVRQRVLTDFEQRKATIPTDKPFHVYTIDMGRFTVTVNTKNMQPCTFKYSYNGNWIVKGL